MRCEEIKSPLSERDLVGLTQSTYHYSLPRPSTMNSHLEKEQDQRLKVLTKSKDNKPFNSFLCTVGLPFLYRVSADPPRQVKLEILRECYRETVKD